jgi:hypothetical protein
VIVVLVVIDFEDYSFTRSVGEIGILRDLKSRDGQITAGSGVVNVKVLLVGETWREGQPQQAALAATIDAARYIKERSLKKLPSA